MQLSLKYEILDTRQEATSFATILLGSRYLHHQLYSVACQSSITH